MASEKAEMDALKKECDGLRTQIEVSSRPVQMTAFAFFSGMASCIADMLVA